MTNVLPTSTSSHDKAGHADGDRVVMKTQQDGQFAESPGGVEMTPECLSTLRNKLAIIKGRSELLTIDGHATESSRNAGRIIGRAVREIEELLGLPARNRELQAAADIQRLKRF